jgi:hypothetical protein
MPAPSSSDARPRAGALAIAVCAAAAATALTLDVPSARRDAFEFFQPAISLAEDDWNRLDRHEPIARVLPGADEEIAVFAAVRVDVDGNRLVAWVRRVEDLKRSSYVPAIGRLSDPPRVEDLAALELDEEDLVEVRTCRPRSCAIALSAEEMRQLQRAQAGAGEWRAAVQREFRRVVLQRVNVYRKGGQHAFAPYESGGESVNPAQHFSALLGHSSFLRERVPLFTEYIDKYPHAPTANVESFLYWSKERLAGRPIISVTHVAIIRGPADAGVDALVAGKQVFATHYLNASLGLTAIVRGHQGSAAYLVYLNRSEVDVLDRWFGGLVRWFAERRVRSEAADILRGLRIRLESGEPLTVREP